MRVSFSAARVLSCLPIFSEENFTENPLCTLGSVKIASDCDCDCLARSTWSLPLKEVAGKAKVRGANEVVGTAITRASRGQSGSFPVPKTFVRPLEPWKPRMSVRTSTSRNAQLSMTPESSNNFGQNMLGLVFRSVGTVALKSRYQRRHCEGSRSHSRKQPLRLRCNQTPASLSCLGV